MPDPCTLDINGVVLGLTSTDLLFHMGAEEISRCHFGGGGGPKKTPQMWDLGGGLLILPLFPHFRLIFPVFHPVFSPFSSSGTSDRFTRILQHILTQRRYRLQPQNGAFLGQNGGISALSHRSPFSAFSYMRNSMGFQSCGG